MSPPGGGGSPGRGSGETQANGLLEEARSRREGLQRAVLGWAKGNLRDFPWRRERSPYRILVAEVILRRTTSTAAARVYEEFLDRWPDLRALARAGTGELEQLLRRVGYHRQRARILKGMAQFILREYRGEIPRDRRALLRIPHVGPYVAGAVLSLGYGVPAAMVDSNVQRILARVFRDHLPETRAPRELTALAEALVPEQEHATFNLALLDLGALICRYDRPRCGQCPLAGLCDTGRSTLRRHGCEHR